MEELTDFQKKVYDHLKSYYEKYTILELEQAEENLFGPNNSKKRRVFLEYERINKKIKSNPYAHIDSLDVYFELRRIIKLMSFDNTLIEEAYKKVLILNIECDLSIRLFSAIPKIIEEYQFFAVKNSKLK